MLCNVCKNIHENNTFVGGLWKGWSTETIHYVTYIADKWLKIYTLNQSFNRTLGLSMCMCVFLVIVREFVGCPELLHREIWWVVCCCWTIRLFEHLLFCCEDASKACRLYTIWILLRGLSSSQLITRFFYDHMWDRANFSFRGYCYKKVQ